MASFCLTKSKTSIIHHLKSTKFRILYFTSHTSFITNSHNLLHTISSPPFPLPKCARINPSIVFPHCFESVYFGRRLHSATSAINDVVQLPAEAPSQQVLDFPGGKVKFTPKLAFTSGSTEERVPCYRVLDENGQPIVDTDSLKISKEVAVKMYTDMVTLEVMDTIFYEAQRQGRISFYATTTGEEAINIASAAALNNDDFVFPQYREPGVLLWRGFTLQEFAHQCFGNKYDNGKGRQMPIHYGSRKHNYFTIASTVATQIPHAVGAAYYLKMEKKDSCVITYFGDGGSSTADFHAAVNFAAVLEVPVIFFCRNNGWAISTPINEQLRSDGVVVRGKAYGVPSIRVDGNDALAIYTAVYEARRMAIEEQTPVLIEALTYRTGHHSTSDDSTKYRSIDEIERWRGDQNPVKRYRKWIESKGWWSDEAESEHHSSIRKQLSQAIQAAERVEKPPIADMFNDVYDVLPKNLMEQEAFIRKTIKKHTHKIIPLMFHSKPIFIIYALLILRSNGLYFEPLYLSCYCVTIVVFTYIEKNHSALEFHTKNSQKLNNFKTKEIHPSSVTVTSGYRLQFLYLHHRPPHGSGRMPAGRPAIMKAVGVVYRVDKACRYKILLFELSKQRCSILSFNII